MPAGPRRGLAPFLALGLAPVPSLRLVLVFDLDFSEITITNTNDLGTELRVLGQAWQCQRDTHQSVGRRCHLVLEKTPNVHQSSTSSCLHGSVSRGCG